MMPPQGYSAFPQSIVMRLTLLIVELDTTRLKFS
jgi:hypothetical protein